MSFNVDKGAEKGRELLYSFYKDTRPHGGRAKLRNAIATFNRLKIDKTLTPEGRLRESIQRLIDRNCSDREIKVEQAVAYLASKIEDDNNDTTKRLEKLFDKINHPEREAFITGEEKAFKKSPAYKEQWLQEKIAQSKEERSALLKANQAVLKDIEGPSFIYLSPLIEKLDAFILKEENSLLGQHKAHIIKILRTLNDLNKKSLSEAEQARMREFLARVDWGIFEPENISYLHKANIHNIEILSDLPAGNQLLASEVRKTLNENAYKILALEEEIADKERELDRLYGEQHELFIQSPLPPSSINRGETPPTSQDDIYQKEEKDLADLLAVIAAMDDEEERAREEPSVERASPREENPLTFASYDEEKALAEALAASLEEFEESNPPKKNGGERKAAKNFGRGPLSSLEGMQRTEEKVKEGIQSATFNISPLAPLHIKEGNGGLPEAFTAPDITFQKGRVGAGSSMQASPLRAASRKRVEAKLDTAQKVKDKGKMAEVKQESLVTKVFKFLAAPFIKIGQWLLACFWWIFKRRNSWIKLS
ncbi:hypothetical protein [Neochlamydia sp. AcF84]|uniref:hypothetical protein n=1 Tax=Neochlamydia sp. AcF84 TaxID=2315858 RepID=UPI00140D8E33|nr:hypothetical protein [Neochlamydia sp. AcF84]